MLGGGHAGIQCALAAAEGGAKVDVVEKCSEDTRKVKGEDIGHCNSKFLIDQGFGPYDVGEIVEEFCIRCGGRVRPELIRKYVANSGEAVDHMMDLVVWPDDRIKIADTTIEPEVSPCDLSQCICQVPGIALDGYTDWPMKRGGYRSWPGTAMFMGTIRHDIDEEHGKGVGAFSRLDEVQQFSILKGQELGAAWHFNETATVLVQDDSGKVIGAITQGPDGYVKYNVSKAVVLATGDYAQNADMVWGLQDELVEWAMRAGKTKEDLVGMSPNMGEGIKMACWAGGFMEASPRATNQNGSGAGGPWGVSPMLWLNAQGKRFMNEDIPGQNIADQLSRVPAGMNPISGAPDLRSWQIFDAKWPTEIDKMPDGHGYVNHFIPAEEVENYATVISIEAKTMIDMIRHDILPAVSNYAADLCARADSKKRMDVPCAYEINTAKCVAEITDHLMEECRILASDLEDMPAGPEEAMRYCHNTLIPDMDIARSSVDALEVLTAAGYWPMPVYSQLLFSV